MWLEGFVAGFVIGGALFYALGWNAALHPGKITGQLKHWYEALRDKLKR